MANETDCRGQSQRCPFCSRKLDADTAVDDEKARPSAGDVSVCAYCAAYLVFDENLLRRPMTDAEFAELHKDTRDLLTRASVLIKRRIGARN